MLAEKCFDQEPIFSASETRILYAHHHLLPPTSSDTSHTSKMICRLLVSQGKLTVILQREIVRLNSLLDHYFSSPCCFYAAGVNKPVIDDKPLIASTSRANDENRPTGTDNGLIDFLIDFHLYG